ncbi:RNase adapter RapZ [Oribacterium sp. HCP28S3_H8]|uniref:RNase adapter RapZ n=1 Tax=Oribacterium sp. HCP28S3_H8 TaxID=3438945 RepID=UPI00303E3263|nr:RNase adapter RapZ [Oribacterium sp.]
MSGAGKTVALKSLEDMGYYCVDNLPIPLIGKFAELLTDGNAEISKAALGVDIRSGKDLPMLKEVFDDWDIKGRVEYEILFLDAADDVLLKRFKETRRAHPLSKDGRVETGIREERTVLSWLKERADYIIDTSHLLTKELRAQLQDIFLKNAEYENLQVTILSFGYKYGIPEDADLLFDVRFLPNPYYVPELKHHTGLEEPVQKYVCQDGVAAEFMVKLLDLIRFLIPHYISEGKNQLVIGIGCTGGHHRSVTIAEMLFQELKKTADYGLRIDHRDIEK